jgi:triosephosphate isomerase
MDPFPPGRGVGGVLAEALRDAGATGTLLSHSERRMSLRDTAAAIGRAHECGLGTMVFADSPEEASDLARLGPDIVLAEPPSLIATGQAVGGAMADFVTRTVELVDAVDPSIIVMSGAGVSSADDVTTVMRLGLGGTGASSGILRAPDPVATMHAMLGAVARAWAELHP